MDDTLPYRQRIDELHERIRELEVSKRFYEAASLRLQRECCYQRQMLRDVLERLPWGRLHYELKLKIEI